MDAFDLRPEDYRQARDDAPVRRRRSRRRADSGDARSCRAVASARYSFPKAGVQFCQRVLQRHGKEVALDAGSDLGWGTLLSVSPRRVHDTGRDEEENPTLRRECVKCREVRITRFAIRETLPTRSDDIDLEEPAFRSLARPDAGLGHGGGLA